ncbi:hypothetical protein F8M41_025575 [Gigaspora margarita]|uniref:Uncharacterized protein n=1 Tax=Gigaspora margarita TaxID=4874 RepID=A0A8H4AZZ8_GIGMA|nr:hypothetical protein F8M41_025575 [Gigaspora margarita]
MLFVMLFFVLINAVSNDLKKRQNPIGQGQHCTDANDYYNCDTKICHLRGEDTGKCQISDKRNLGEAYLIDAACKAPLFCSKDDKFCRSKTTPTLTTLAQTPVWSHTPYPLP